jgi:hypothetical protein
MMELSEVVAEDQRGTRQSAIPFVNSMNSASLKGEWDHV